MQNWHAYTCRVFNRNVMWNLKVSQDFSDMDMRGIYTIEFITFVELNASNL